MTRLRLNQRLRLNADKVAKSDPTKTFQLRQRAVAEINRRFGKIRVAVRQAVTVGGLVTNAVSPGQFEYVRDAEKIPLFNQWLQGEIDREILGIASGIIPAPEDHWLNVYVGDAYERGAKKTRFYAERNITGLTSLPDYHPLTNPIHAERAELIFTRVYSDLKGVTEVMSNQISRELANGMIRGLNPKEVAANMADRVDKVGISRSRLIARTEIVESHGRAAANEARMLATETGVEIEMVWLGAEDSRERPSHVERNNNIYPIDVAESMLGEPNCRCSISAYIDIAKI